MEREHVLTRMHFFSPSSVKKGPVPSLGVCLSHALCGFGGSLLTVGVPPFWKL